jgi:predicted N-formylglutamate amidohydrolase
VPDDARVSELPPLLTAADPEPFVAFDAAEGSPYVMTADHAGREIPSVLGSLGLTQAELDTHIAWDIGIGGVSRSLQRELGAFLILQTYSRLVIDCNRPLEAPSSIAELSEHTEIPGNRDLSDAERTRRVQAVFMPYHARIEQELARRENAGEQTILIAMHSFTPRYKGVNRPWQVGVLYNRDARLAHALLRTLADEGLTVGDNEPYFVSDESDFGIPRYGEQRGHVHVELEIRQDLIAEPEGQARMSELVARAMRAASAPFIR